jgi:hypothetical protein
MILLGLPNETIEHHQVLGDILVSYDELTSVVTFVYGGDDQMDNLPVLYSLFSTCYDSEVFDNSPRKDWLIDLMAKHSRRVSIAEKPYLHCFHHELLAVQAQAFANIEQLKRNYP